MKKILLVALFVLGVSFAFAGCSGDSKKDEEVVPPPGGGSVTLPGNVTGGATQPIVGPAGGSTPGVPTLPGIPSLPGGGEIALPPEDNQIENGGTGETGDATIPVVPGTPSSPADVILGVSGMVPTNKNASGLVSVKSAIKVTFNKGLADTSLINANAFKLEDNKGNRALCTVKLNTEDYPTVITFVPNEDLAYDMLYLATLNFRIDEFGSQTVVSKSLKFKTEAAAGAAQVAGPNIKSVMPVANATDVGVDTDIVVTFDKVVNVDTFKAGFSLKDNLGNPYPAGDLKIKPLISSDTFHVYPVKQLNYDTTYTVKLDSSISDTEWKFTTKKMSFATAVAVGKDDDVYVAGVTKDSLESNLINNKGGFDVFVAKYGADGQKKWLKQLGTPKDEMIVSIALDSADNVYAVGYTYGYIPALSTKTTPDMDSFIVKFDKDGNMQLNGIRFIQFGTSGKDDAANGVTVDKNNNVYVSGYSTGAVYGSDATEGGPYIIKYSSLGIRQVFRQYEEPGTAFNDTAVSLDGEKIYASLLDRSEINNMPVVILKTDTLDFSSLAEMGQYKGIASSISVKGISERGDIREYITVSGGVNLVDGDGAPILAGIITRFVEPDKLEMIGQSPFDLVNDQNYISHVMGSDKIMYLVEFNGPVAVNLRTASFLQYSAPTPLDLLPIAGYSVYFPRGIAITNGGTVYVTGSKSTAQKGQLEQFVTKVH